MRRGIQNEQQCVPDVHQKLTVKFTDNVSRRFMHSAPLAVAIIERVLTSYGMYQIHDACWTVLTWTARLRCVDV